MVVDGVESVRRCIAGNLRRSGVFATLVTWDGISLIVMGSVRGVFPEITENQREAMTC